MKRKRFLIIAAIAVIVLVFALDVRLLTVEYTVESEKITGEVRIALVTDLHSCRYGEGQKSLLDAIDGYSPDAVLMVGDIFDDKMKPDNAEEFISSVAEKYKTYYVSGNHEWWSGEMYEIFGFLEENGVTVLRGGTELLTAGDDTIAVSGIDDPDIDQHDSGYVGFEEQLKTVGESVDGRYYNLLLSHRPERAEEYFEYDFDIVLSGHAHGGQFRFPYLINGLYAPNQGIFPKLAGGRYTFDNGILIVSRGLSRENQIVPRIFNRPELVFVTLS